MRIGIDLDNTIVCYDGLFHQVAVRRGLIPSDVATDKQAVRDFLRDDGRPDEWTELQGLVYGNAMSEAKPYAGVVEFLEAATRHGSTTFVISHRTRYPYRGPRHDLHAAARAWLASHGLAGPPRTGLPAANVFLEVSLEDKLRRIVEQGCDVFIDDLPELLLHAEFPETVERVCFDPVNRCADTGLQRVAAWSELTNRWFGGDDA
jgi:hypothetical protein